MGALRTLRVPGSVQVCLEEVRWRIATGAVDVVVFEIIAHIRHTRRAARRKPNIIVNWGGRPDGKGRSCNETIEIRSGRDLEESVGGGPSKDILEE